MLKNNENWILSFATVAISCVLIIYPYYYLTQKSCCYFEVTMDTIDKLMYFIPMIIFVGILYFIIIIIAIKITTQEND
ncbi:MAG: hypothetical protein ACFFD1_00880 [Candidatus Thorarchaeota archaeon]